MMDGWRVPRYRYSFFLLSPSSYCRLLIRSNTDRNASHPLAFLRVSYCRAKLSFNYCIHDVFDGDEAPNMFHTSTSRNAVVLKEPWSKKALFGSPDKVCQE